MFPLRCYCIRINVPIAPVVFSTPLITVTKARLALLCLLFTIPNNYISFPFFGVEGRERCIIFPKRRGYTFDKSWDWGVLVSIVQLNCALCLLFIQLLVRTFRATTKIGNQAFMGCQLFWRFLHLFFYHDPYPYPTPSTPYSSSPTPTPYPLPLPPIP